MPYMKFHPGYLPDGKARPLGGNAPTQNLPLQIWVGIINFWREFPPSYSPQQNTIARAYICPYLHVTLPSGPRSSSSLL